MQNLDLSVCGGGVCVHVYVCVPLLFNQKKKTQEQYQSELFNFKMTKFSRQNSHAKAECLLGKCYDAVSK